jgi:hypothetical protein
LFQVCPHDGNNNIIVVVVLVVVKRQKKKEMVGCATDALPLPADDDDGSSTITMLYVARLSSN